MQGYKIIIIAFACIIQECAIKIHVNHKRIEFNDIEVLKYFNYTSLACIPFHLLMDVLVPSLHRKSTDTDDALCQDLYALMHDCSSVG